MPKIRKTDSGITYYLFEDLKEMFTEEEMIAFGNWFIGKTGIICPETGKFGYYTWDIAYFEEVILRKRK